MIIELAVFAAAAYFGSKVSDKVMQKERQSNAKKSVSEDKIEID